jgi:hypothetical protein
MRSTGTRNKAARPLAQRYHARWAKAAVQVVAYERQLLADCCRSGCMGGSATADGL